jgi:hypothetical protein
MRNGPRMMNSISRTMRGALLALCLAGLVLQPLACSGTAASDSPGTKMIRSDQSQAASPPSRQGTTPKEMGDHYLMLVNTAIAQFMTDDKLRQFDTSYYDGIAIAFLHAYDTSPVPSVTEMDRQLTAWKQDTSKDIWPWVYVNRMIGSNLAEKNHYADNPYFNAIPGVDLDDSKGALTDFLKIWSNSIAAARDSKAPGIVLDLEFYNNYKEYDISEIASKTGKTSAQAADSLKRIGARMADSAADIYPHATLWLLFTALTHPGYKKIDGVSYYPSPAYISVGMLDEIVSKKLPLRVLAGGEGSIGYCHDSIAEFKTAIAKRQEDMATTLLQYSGVLELGGTMSLWSDRKLKKNTCNSSDADTIEDLEPSIELLLKTYRYNWLYATSEANYYPFSNTSAPRFDAVIRKAREATGWNKQKTTNTK